MDRHRDVAVSNVEKIMSKPTTVVTAGTKPGRPFEAGSARASERATRAALARAKSGRRRGVDPTTCERDYAPAELEFMEAIQCYKQESGRMFPTWSEVLEVVRALGYEKSPA